MLNTIEFGMRFQRGKATNATLDVAIGVLAKMVRDHLELCGFVIKKRPPRDAHATPGSGCKGHLTD